MEQVGGGEVAGKEFNVASVGRVTNRSTTVEDKRGRWERRGWGIRRGGAFQVSGKLYYLSLIRYFNINRHITI